MVVEGAKGSAGNKATLRGQAGVGKRGWWDSWGLWGSGGDIYFFFFLHFLLFVLLFLHPLCWGFLHSFLSSVQYCFQSSVQARERLCGVRPFQDSLPCAPMPLGCYHSASCGPTVRKFICGLWLVHSIITIIMPHVVRPFENSMHTTPCTMCGLTFRKMTNPCFVDSITTITKPHVVRHLENSMHGLPLTMCAPTFRKLIAPCCVDSIVVSHLA